MDSSLGIVVIKNPEAEASGTKAQFRGTTRFTLDRVTLELKQVLSLLRGVRVSLLAQGVHETNSGSSILSLRTVSQHPTAL